MSATDSDASLIVTAPRDHRDRARPLPRPHRELAGGHRSRPRILPLGVPSSLPGLRPAPDRRAPARQAAWLEDVDGNRYVDFDMGFGALFAGHCHPRVRAAVEEQLDDGTLFVTPCEINADVAELLGERYGLPMWRFTNSGTEATMDAIRVARGVTGRDKIVKVEGGYHGHHDEVMVSMKPPLDAGRPGRRADAGAATAGITAAVLADTHRHPVQRRRRARAGAARRRRRLLHRRAGDGEHRHLPAASPATSRPCARSPQRHGTLLIFDEVKTGITAGWGGATGALRRAARPRRAGQVHRRRPAARRLRRQAEYMDQITAGQGAAPRHVQRQPAVMAAAKAVLAEVCTPEATAGRAIARNAGCSSTPATRSSPAPACRRTPCSSAPRAASRSRPTPVRNYRDYKATDFDLAFAQWIHGINRGILLPPGLDEQWLISVHAHRRRRRCATPTCSRSSSPSSPR